MKTYECHTGGFRLKTCTYGLSRLQFRGPRRPTEGRFVACLGGSDTIARYAPTPFPDLVETAIGEICVNLGVQAAGPDVYLHDPALKSLRHDAAATILQAPSATNLSNDYFRVHPRRNDRFVAPTDRLIRLFPEVDFAEISFTGHLISRLRAVDEARFAMVRTSLQAAWLTRMTQLIETTPGPVVLLWFSALGEGADGGVLYPAHSTAFVSQEMITALSDCVDATVQVAEHRNDVSGLAFPPLDALAAQNALSLAAHQTAARALRGPVMNALA